MQGLRKTDSFRGPPHRETYLRRVIGIATCVCGRADIPDEIESLDAIIITNEISGAAGELGRGLPEES